MTLKASNTHFWQKLFFKHNDKRLNLYYAIMVAHGMLLITIEVKESREFQFLYVLSWTNKCLTKIAGIINWKILVFIFMS